jgi:hypothetical protein
VAQLVSFGALSITTGVAALLLSARLAFRIDKTIAILQVRLAAPEPAGWPLTRLGRRCLSIFVCLGLSAWGVQLASTVLLENAATIAVAAGAAMLFALVTLAWLYLYASLLLLGYAVNDEPGAPRGPGLAAPSSTADS